MMDLAEPADSKYGDQCGTFKSGPGCWVVNDSRGRRLGLVVRQERQWRPECDRMCDELENVRGDREASVDRLWRHWNNYHGFVETS